MILKPCPVCGNNTLQLLSLTGMTITINVGEEITVDNLKGDTGDWLLVIISCNTCEAVFDPSLVIENFELPKFGRDEKGYYIEGTGSVEALSTFPLELPYRWSIKEETDLGALYIAFMKIITAETVAELPVKLVSDNAGLRHFAAKRMEELKG